MRHRPPNTPEGRADAAHWAQVFRDNAERWWSRQGKIVPVKGTPEYRDMYNAWVDYMRTY